MSSIIPPARYVCYSCMQRTYAPQIGTLSQTRWRCFSTPIRQRPRDDGSRAQETEKLLDSRVKAQQLAQASKREPRRGRIRGGRARIPKSGQSELEELAKISSSQPEHMEVWMARESEASQKAAPQSTPEVQPGRSAAKEPPKKRLSSITTIFRPSDFNLYWDTFPPTFQERSRAIHFFRDTCSTSPPQLLTSAERFMQVPDSDLPEVAFVGRSNVGKSSLLNAIVNADMKKLLARTSATRGFTKTMNFYGIGPANGVSITTNPKGHKKIVGHGGLVLVDMPGYGEGSLAQWGVEIMKYLQSRKQLRRVFVLLDAEHGIKEKDRSLLASLRLAGVSHQIILSKVDKLYIPQAKDLKRIEGRKSVPMKAKGTINQLRTVMEELKPEIQPPVGGGSLGEILACSSQAVVDGARFGVDHIRYAILKAVGLDRKPSRPGKRARETLMKKGLWGQGKDNDEE